MYWSKRIAWAKKLLEEGDEKLLFTVLLLGIQDSLSELIGRLGNGDK